MEGTYFDYDYTGAAEEATEAASAAASGGTLFQVGTIVCAVMIVAIFVMMIITLLKVANIQKRVNSVSMKVGNMDNGSSDKEIGVVFCKKCGSQYNVTDKECPYCGVKR